LTALQAGIAPRYEFGFGLSYTTFAYSSISVSGSVGSYTPPSGPGSSLDARFVGVLEIMACPADIYTSLHAKVFTVSFTLTNNGTVAGHEVPQVCSQTSVSADTTWLSML
jgi:beta-glucosidase